jgi:hypothetical protein
VHELIGHLRAQQIQAANRFQVIKVRPSRGP